MLFVVCVVTIAIFVYSENNHSLIAPGKVSYVLSVPTSLLNFITTIESIGEIIEGALIYKH
jgi:hypothetical protein